MDIKKSEVVKLSRIFEYFKSQKLGRKFSYFITRNNIKLKDEVEALKEIMAPSEKYQEFDKKRAEIASNMADKDDKGKPIIVNNSYQIIENQSKFDKTISDLRTEYKEAIEEFEKTAKVYNEILKETVPFEPYAIGIDNLPDELEPEIMEILVENGLITE